MASELGKVIIIQVDEIVDCTSPSDFNFQLSTDSLASCFYHMSGCQDDQTSADAHVEGAQVGGVGVSIAS